MPGTRGHKVFHRAGLGPGGGRKGVPWYILTTPWDSLDEQGDALNGKEQKVSQLVGLVTCYLQSKVRVTAPPENNPHSSMCEPKDPAASGTGLRSHPCPPQQQYFQPCPSSVQVLWPQSSAPSATSMLPLEAEPQPEAT